MRRTLLVALALAVASACGGLTLPSGETVDRPDGSTSGSGSGGASSDGAVGDSGSSDSSFDASTSDAETSDAGEFDAAEPEAGTPDSGPLFFGPQCPVTQPTNGGTCQVVGGVCEYGDGSANPYCDEQDICYQIGGWSNEALPLNLCGRGTCPAAYADVVPGGACPMQNLVCGYPEGPCNCSAPPDGGADAGALGWYCYAPSGCPEPRPRLGAYCSPRGMVCDYGSCTGGVAQACTLVAGWVLVTLACP